MANDLPPVPPSWGETLDKILKIIIALTTTIGMLLAAWNNRKAADVQTSVATVQTHQAANAEVLKEVKTEAAEAKVHAMKAANK